MIIKTPTLITLHVLYWIPDYEGLLQSFTWQLEDYNPEYPRVHHFLDHWYREINAVINEVYVLDNNKGIRVAQWSGTLS